MDADDRPAREAFDAVRVDSSRYLTTEVAGDTFLLDEHTGATFRLGGSGPRLWQLLADGATIKEAAQVLADETHANPKRVSADTHHFVSQLSELGIELDVGQGDSVLQ